jgi:hypothetical protein
MTAALRTFAALSVLALAACAQGQSVAGAGAAAAAACDPQAAQFAVGYTYTEALAAEARNRSGASVVRVLRPGQATTMEYSEDRINLEVDAGNRVTRVRCG